MTVFRIWYADGAVIEGENAADWARAPSESVQLVCAFDDVDAHGRSIGAVHQGADYYWMHKGEIGCGRSRPEPWQLVPYDGPKGAAVKTGSWLSDRAYEAVVSDFVAWLKAHREREAA